MTKNYVCCAQYLRNHASYDCHLWNTCKMVTHISRRFFHFFKIVIFWVSRRVNGQKMVQNDKKFCPLHSMSQEPYIIWLSCMVHICKMIISSGGFFVFVLFFCFFQVFKILIFLVRRGVKGQKRCRMTENSLCCTPYRRNHASYDCHLWYKCVKWYLQLFFQF